jgi:hypothetical protein
VDCLSRDMFPHTQLSFNELGAGNRGISTHLHTTGRVLSLPVTASQHFLPEVSITCSTVHKGRGSERGVQCSMQCMHMPHWQCVCVVQRVCAMDCASDHTTNPRNMHYVSWGHHMQTPMSISRLALELNDHSFKEILLHQPQWRGWGHSP